MAAYKVVKFFTDLQDNNRPYNVGDTFPHVDNSHVSEHRLAELASCDNLQGVPLIQWVEDKPKRTRAKKTAEK